MVSLCARVMVYASPRSMAHRSNFLTAPRCQCREIQEQQHDHIVPEARGLDVWVSSSAHRRGSLGDIGGPEGKLLVATDAAEDNADIRVVMMLE